MYMSMYAIKPRYATKVLWIIRHVVVDLVLAFVAAGWLAGNI